MSDHHAPTGHEAPAAAPAAEGSKIVQQVLWVLAAIILVLAIWRTVVEMESDDSTKKSSSSFIDTIDDWWTEKTSPASLGQPADYEVLETHLLQPGEVWATPKLTGKMTITADDHKFAIQFTGCEEEGFTEFNGKQSSFPPCSEAGPALIKMGEGETKPFLVQIQKKK